MGTSLANSLATRLGFQLGANVNQNKTYYVRPSGGDYSVEDGTSYETAWDGFSNIVWDSISAGDTLYVCGEHSEALVVGASGTSENQIVIRFDYVGDAGSIDATGLNIGMNISQKSYITVNSGNIANATISNLNIGAPAVGIITNDLIVDASGNQNVQHLGAVIATHNNITTTNATDDGISIHETGIITINGCTVTGNREGINAVAGATVYVSGETTFSGNTLYDIYSTNATSAASVVIDVTGATLPTKVYSTGSGKVILRNCKVTGELEVTAGYLDAYDTIVTGTRLFSAGSIVNLENTIITATTSYNVDGTHVYSNSSVAGVLTVEGTLTAENTLFSGGGTNHTISGAGVVDLQYCVFDCNVSAKFGILSTTGGTYTINNCTFYGGSKIGRGIFTLADTTANNCIFNDCDIAVFRSTGTTILNNCCLYNNSTDISGTVTQNDSVTTNPLLADVVNNDFSLGVGSSCIGTGKDLGETYNTGIDTADWGDASNPPVITTKVQGVNWDIGAYIS